MHYNNAHVHYLHTSVHLYPHAMIPEAESLATTRYSVATHSQPHARRPARMNECAPSRPGRGPAPLSLGAGKRFQLQPRGGNDA